MTAVLVPFIIWLGLRDSTHECALRIPYESNFHVFRMTQVTLSLEFDLVVQR